MRVIGPATHIKSMREKHWYWRMVHDTARRASQNEFSHARVAKCPHHQYVGAARPHIFLDHFTDGSARCIHTLNRCIDAVHSQMPIQLFVGFVLWNWLFVDDGKNSDLLCFFQNG